MYNAYSAASRAAVLATAITALALPIGRAQAQNYNWATWTQAGPQTAVTTAASGATVTVSTAGPQTVTANFGIRFDNVAFTPVNAQSAIVGTGGSFAPWSYRVDFTSVASTAGIVVGLGNFGHNVSSYPGYRMTAYNKQGGVMSLASFGMLGSCDHTWTPTGQQFNDDLALNLSNGNFVVTPVAGLNNTNSDILLMAMPSNLGWLDVTTLGPSAGDSVNVVIAVPAPGAASLLGMVGLLATRCRR